MRGSIRTSVGVLAMALMAIAATPPERIKDSAPPPPVAVDVPRQVPAVELAAVAMPGSVSAIAVQLAVRDVLVKIDSSPGGGSHAALVCTVAMVSDSLLVAAKAAALRSPHDSTSTLSGHERLTRTTRYRPGWRS